MKIRVPGVLRRAVTAALAAAVLGVQPAPAQEEATWHDARRLRALVASDAASLDDSLRLAALELRMGDVDAAAAIVGPLRRALSSRADVLALSARVEEAQGRQEAAAVLYEAAAATAAGDEAGIMHARAGVAYERARLGTMAARQYQEAGLRLPAVAAWLAVREAGVEPSPLRAYELLRRPPPAAAPLVWTRRAELLLASGDTARAARAFVRAGRRVAAARLLLAHRDTASARSMAFYVLAQGSTTETGTVLGELSGVLVAARPAEEVLLAEAYRRVGQHENRTLALERALGMVRPNARGFRLLGDAYADAGRLDDAARAYARAAALGGADGSTAAYRGAMLLARQGSRADYRAALLRFAHDFPMHRAAPEAVWLVAEELRGAGRRSEATEIYRRLDAMWSPSPQAAGARLALAETSRRAGDQAAAEEWYSREIDLRGPERYAATYLLADLWDARGQSAGARDLWERLANEDPWGYHGAMARRALGLVLPRLGSGTGVQATARVQSELAVLDLLTAAGLIREASLQVESLLAGDGLTLDERLAAASGLVSRGWTNEGIRMGWTVAAERSLSDPAVLQVVFPWPLRDLIEREAAEHGVDPYLLAALIRQESTFRPDAASRAGARGLMQLMPSTAAWLAERGRLEWHERLLVVPDANLHIGAAHLASLIAAYDGDVIPALAAYNAGGRPTARWRRASAGNGPFEFVRGITYTETRQYVQAVLRNHDLYRALYPAANSVGNEP